MAELHHTGERFSFQSYHIAWLAAHPHRSAAWLKEKLVDGFHVHHVDGDHSNDDPLNLILIDGTDHLRLHGMELVAGISSWRGRAYSKKPMNPEYRVIYKMRLDIPGTWSDFARVYYGEVKPRDASWHDIGMDLFRKAKLFAKDSGEQWPLKRSR